MSHSPGAHLFVEVRVNGAAAYFDAAVIRSTALLPWLERLPEMPEALAGFWRVRDAVIPVLDLARLLGAESGPVTSESALLHVALPAGDVAFLVERIVRAAAHPAETLRPVPADSSWNAACQALLATENELAPVFDPTRLLTLAEQQRLREFAARAEVRLRELFALPA